MRGRALQVRRIFPALAVPTWRDPPRMHLRAVRGQHLIERLEVLLVQPKLRHEFRPRVVEVRAQVIIHRGAHLLEF